MLAQSGAGEQAKWIKRPLLEDSLGSGFEQPPGPSIQGLYPLPSPDAMKLSVMLGAPLISGLG